MKQPFNNKKLSAHIKLAKVTVSNEVRDYSNDPAVVKSTQKAKECLEKHPLPEDLLKMIDAQYGKK